MSSAADCKTGQWVAKFEQTFSLRKEKGSYGSAGAAERSPAAPFGFLATMT